MNLRLEQLGRALEGGLAPVYLLAGAEPLLLQEARDAVLGAARARGFNERKLFHVGRGFDWGEVRLASSERSLFSSRQVADVRLPGGKPGMEGARVLSGWAEDPDPDVLLILSCGEWDTATRKSAWASKLAAAGALVEIWPVPPEALPKWIEQRMQLRGLIAESEACQLLAQLAEGNLLAAQQEIDKLALIAPGGRVNARLVSQSAADNARYSAFRLGECVFGGRPAEALRVASGLQRTGTAIQVVTAALQYQITQLEAVQSALRAGESEARVFGRLRVIRMMQPLLRQASRRIASRRLGDAFRALALMDRQGKGQAAGDPWQTLDRLILTLCAYAPAPRRAAAG